MCINDVTRHALSLMGSELYQVLEIVSTLVLFGIEERLATTTK